MVSMRKRLRYALAAVLTVLAVIFVVLLIQYFSGHPLAVLSPKGTIALQERHLILTATLLMLIVVVPVFILTGSIAWKFRANNEEAKYTPDWDHHNGLEFIWWAVPTIIITILAVITWQSSHALDPFKPLASDKQPITIQVIALQWRWLFIYPDQNIASLNFVEFPENTPVHFVITSDAPMNSFWIPELGGQVYAMAGMATQLHLMADGVGAYNGVSANISGAGFADMKFIAKSASVQDFGNWVESVRQSPSVLTQQIYNQLAQPIDDPSIVYYASSQSNLFNTVINKFMVPPVSSANTATIKTASANYGSR